MPMQCRNNPTTVHETAVSIEHPQISKVQAGYTYQMPDYPPHVTRAIDGYQYEWYMMYLITTYIVYLKFTSPSSIFSPRSAFLFSLLKWIVLITTITVISTLHANTP